MSTQQKWKYVGKVLKSSYADDQYYIKINEDVSLKKDQTISMFEPNFSRLGDLVEKGSLTPEQAESIQANTKYELAIKNQ